MIQHLAQQPSRLCPCKVSRVIPWDMAVPGRGVWRLTTLSMYIYIKQEGKIKLCTSTKFFKMCYSYALWASSIPPLLFRVSWCLGKKWGVWDTPFLTMSGYIGWRLWFLAHLVTCLEQFGGFMPSCVYRQTVFLKVHWVHQYSQPC